jgi:FtsH ternary system-associated peptide
MERRFVEHLPDLITPDEYGGDPAGRRVRVRIRITAEGVEVIGDAVRPDELERLLGALDPAVLEQMLCG